MEKLISFFEIPAADFHRAVAFYETVLDTQIQAESCETEKMGFFPNCEGAISYSPQIKPTSDGVLISLKVKNVEQTLAKVEKLGGKTIIPKTAIKAEGRGYLFVFLDCEGNKVGLHEK
ncbi:MAG TPA: VOC family protein [Bacteroidales bacterium]|nr:VOC family protein [Bacteroidales bacterium]